jgi:hypothetical protein
MKKAILIVFLSISLPGCGILLIDVPFKVPIKGQEVFVYKKFKTKKDMYIVKYPGEIGYYMHSQYDPTVESVVLIPKGSTLVGCHITRLNGWPNGTFYNYVARLENWEIFHPQFVVQSKMDANLFYPLDEDFFESID